MNLVCNAEAKAAPKGPNKSFEIAVWIEANVHHPEVLKLLSSIGAQDKVEGDKRLRDAALRYGIENCPIATPPPAETTTVDVPMFDPADATAQGQTYKSGTAVLNVTPQEISYQGARVVALTNGVPEATQIVDGELTALQKILGDSKTAPDDLYIAIDKTVPYATMHLVWASLAPVTERALVVKKGTELHVVPMSVYTLKEDDPGKLVLTKTEIVDMRAGSTRWKYPDAFGTFVREALKKYDHPGSDLDQRTIELGDTHTVDDFFKLVAPLTKYVRPAIKRSTK
jgi:hypothetical protein